MHQMITAAVLHGMSEDLQVHDDIEQAPPGPGEVKVKVVASGVCHSDLSVQNGTIPLPTPIVLGHEGAGIVEETGEGVSSLAPGDHVVLSFVPACGSCFYCARDQGFLCEKSAMAAGGGLLDGTTRLTHGGQGLGQMAMCGTFGNYAIVPEISAVKIDDDVDLRYAALIGCGVLTGVGAALNTASIRPGDSVAVVGCGGVGLNVIQGAKIAGAEKIIAIDMFESKLKMAEQFGATDLVKADEGDPVGTVMTLTGGRGADVAFEVIGLGPTIEQTINMTRNGGEAILVGVPRMDVMLNLNAAFTFLYLAKTVKGCWYGSANVRTDVPKLIGLYKEGKLKLEELVSREIGVDGVNEAFTAMQAGEVARSLITHQH
ncbi:MAG: Zn-dependent alcohol dehydrogenase [Acidimicrobiales bacterium]|nr:Zn-dependent alcohol dehydrogenase [Acidimicrobiales bacterium]